MREGMRLSENDDTQTVIIDVRDVPLEILLNGGNPALAHTLRAVAAELVQPAGNYAAHGSTPMP